MEMILFVLDDPGKIEQLLDEWRSIGITGVTVMESTGFHRLKKRIPMPFAYTAGNIVEEGHLTLFAIVKDNSVVKKCLAVTEKVVGDLNEPNTGVFASWMLDLTKGASAKKLSAEE